jgi:hypothetical protein
MPLSTMPIVTPAPLAPLAHAVMAPCCDGPVERLYSLVVKALVGVGVIVGVGLTVGVGVGVGVGLGAGAGVEIVPPPPPHAATSAAGPSAARMPTSRSWVIAMKDSPYIRTNCIVSHGLTFKVLNGDPAAIR